MYCATPPPPAAAAALAHVLFIGSGFTVGIHINCGFSTLH